MISIDWSVGSCYPTYECQNPEQDIRPSISLVGRKVILNDMLHAYVSVNGNNNVEEHIDGNIDNRRTVMQQEVRFWMLWFGMLWPPYANTMEIGVAMASALEVKWKRRKLKALVSGCSLQSLSLAE